MVDSAIREYFSTRFRPHPENVIITVVSVLKHLFFIGQMSGGGSSAESEDIVQRRTETLMSILETLQQPVHANASAKTEMHEAERRREDHQANERTSIAETVEPADLKQRDRAIETQARAELQESSYYSIRHVSCDVCQCVVTLSGCVPSFYIKQIAQTIVRQLEGSFVIDNQLEVDRT